jgi:hypothetical protein
VTGGVCDELEGVDGMRPERAQQASASFCVIVVVV